MQAWAPRRLLLLAPAILAVGATFACGGEEPVVFTHGVASGDARPDAVLLWTRVDREATLTVEVAADAAFANLAVEAEVRAESESDFTVKAEAAGLTPDTAYYYRFRRGDDVSDVGAFRTAPETDAAAPVRFIFSGDSDGTMDETGARAFDFKVLDTARGEEADFFLYFGDTIYADSPFGPKAETLEEYRGKYKENRDISRLRQILASTSIYTTWDDHEVENDFAGATVDPALLAAGRQAFREYMPISGDDTPEVLYRTFRWGKAVELIILDERSFRDDDVAEACIPEGGEEADLLPALGAPDVPPPYRAFRGFVDLPEDTAAACLDALNDPERTMLGAAQKQFLLDALKQSDATFKFIVNEVAIAELVAQPYDRWDGYRAERDEILRFIDENEISNVIFLTTDYHANVVSDVRLDVIGELATDPVPAPIAIEAIAGPIAHETLGDTVVRTQGEELAAAFEELLVQVSGLTCLETSAFSYGLVEVDPEAGTATITLKDEDANELCQTVVEAA